MFLYHDIKTGGLRALRVNHIRKNIWLWLVFLILAALMIFQLLHAGTPSQSFFLVLRSVIFWWSFYIYFIFKFCIPWRFPTTYLKTNNSYPPLNASMPYKYNVFPVPFEVFSCNTKLIYVQCPWHFVGYSKVSLVVQISISVLESWSVFLCKRRVFLLVSLDPLHDWFCDKGYVCCCKTSGSSNDQRQL